MTKQELGKAVAVLRDEGMTFRQAGEALGITAQWANRCYVERHMQAKSRGRAALSEEVIEKALELFVLTGAEAAAKATGVSEGTIRINARKRGVTTDVRAVSEERRRRELCRVWPVLTKQEVKALVASSEKCSGCYWGKVSDGGKIVCFWRKCEREMKTPAVVGGG